MEQQQLLLENANLKSEIVELKMQQSSSSAASSNVKVLEAEMNILRRTSTNLQGVNDRLQAENQDLSKRIDRIRKSQQSEFSDYSNLKTKNSQLEMQQKILESKVDRLEKKEEEWKSRYSGKVGEIRELNKEIESLRSSGAEDTYKKLQEQLRVHQQGFENINEMIIHLKSEIAQRDDFLEEMEEKELAYLEELNELKATLNKMKKKNELNE